MLCTRSLPFAIRVNDAPLISLPHRLSDDAALWLVDLDVEAGRVDDRVLSPSERERAARFVSVRDARRYLATRHALRRVLAQALSCPPASIAIEPDAFGKPHLVAERGLFFSVSRSGNAALIGTSRSAAIGVDIEQLRAVFDAAALAGAYFTDVEREQWSRTRARADAAFLTCWTRKEACLKALGVGLFAPPRAVDAGCVDVIRTVQVPLAAGRCEVRVHPLHVRDAAAAVALTAPGEAARARDIMRAV